MPICWGMTVGSLIGQLENVHIPLIATIAFFSRPLQADRSIGLRFEGGGPGWGWP